MLEIQLQILMKISMGEVGFSTAQFFLRTIGIGEWLVAFECFNSSRKGEEVVALRVKLRQQWISLR